jgi:two-component system, NarL family, response regulator DesR
MIRIVIAEDQELLLGIIGSLLNLEDDMEVVGQSGKGEELLALVEKLRPDICLMDMEFFEKNSPVEMLKPFGGKLMVLTTFAEAGNFQRIVDADVRGYLPKDSPSEELAIWIRSIMDGKRIYSEELIETPREGIEGAASADILSVEQDIAPTPDAQQKPLDTVKSYLTTFKDKIKISAG